MVVGRLEASVSLLLVFVTALFGPGFQAVPVVALGNLALCLSGVLLAESLPQLGALLVAQAAGSGLAYLRAFGEDAGSAVATMSTTLLVNLLFGIILTPTVRGLPKRFEAFRPERLGVLCFPVTLTAFYAIAAAAGPTGSWGNPAYAFALASSSGTAQLGALFGLDTINLFSGWLASLVAYFYLVPMVEEYRASARARLSGDQFDIQDEVSTNLNNTPLLAGADAVETAEKLSKRKQHVDRFVLISGFCMLLASTRSLNEYGKFFQADISGWQQNTINAVCLAGYGSKSSMQSRLDVTSKVLGQQLFLNKDLSPAHPDLVLWSEASVEVYSREEESTLLAKMGDLAKEYNALIGFGYTLTFSEDSKEHQAGWKNANMFALVVESGEVAFQYQKNHPVPIVEKGTQPGSHLPPVVATRFGRVSGAICYDLDFPNFIARAASQGKGAELFLQPGWDWGPIGTLHARMAAMRAVEQGMTVFRCSSGGVSGVYGPFGQVYSEVITGTDMGLKEMDSTAAYTSLIPMPTRHFTPYQFFGSALSNLCIVCWLLMIVLLLLPMEWIFDNPWLTRFLAPVQTSL